MSEALTDGFALAFLGGAILVATAAVLTFLWIPGSPDPAARPLARKVLLGAAAAVAVFVAIDVGVPRSEAAPPGEFTTEGALTFASAPGLHPPQLLHGQRAPGPEHG